MGTGLNTYSNISSFVNTIFEDALFVARERAFMAGLVTGFSGTGMAARKNQVYGTATISQIGEDDDLSSQTFHPTALSTLTPYEYGAQFLLTDQRMDTDPFGARQDAALELGNAMGEKINQDLLGDLGSLTGGTIGSGSGGETITWSSFFAAKARLREAAVPEPYICVLHEYQWWRLAKAASVAATTAPGGVDLANAITGAYYVQTVGGVRIYTTGDITVDGSGDAKGGMFNPVAIALDTRRAPRIEAERDASRRGTELNLSAVYAHGTWRPAFGVTMYFDAGTPS